MAHSHSTDRPAKAKAFLKRAGYADGGDISNIRPTPRPAYATDGMTPTEAKNYDVLKASPKGWSDSDARDMATNPSGRLPPLPDTPQNQKRGGRTR